MIKQTATAIRRLNVFTGKASSILILVLIAVVLYEVLSRYLFDAPTKWSNEISEYLLAGVVMLAGGYCLVNDEHVRVDIFHRYLSPRGLAVVEIITFVVVASFVSAMVWKGGLMTIEAWQQDKRSMTILEMPLFPSMAMVPIGASLLGLQSLARFLLAVLQLVTPNNRQDLKG